MQEKILHLTLKKKWFDMIASGEKLEEYRELKPYWFLRLMVGFLNGANKVETVETFYKVYGEKMFKRFDYIIFRNGYASNAPTIKVQCLGITIGHAKPEWSDNWQGEVFIIKLGELLTQ